MTFYFVHLLFVLVNLGWKDTAQRNDRFILLHAFSLYFLKVILTFFKLDFLEFLIKVKGHEFLKLLISECWWYYDLKALPCFECQLIRVISFSFIKSAFNLLLKDLFFVLWGVICSILLFNFQRALRAVF